MFRLLCAVWVLGLGSWCFGQVGPLEDTADPRWVDRDLVLGNTNETETTLDLPDQVRETEDAQRLLPSEELEEAIREDLAKPSTLPSVIPQRELRAIAKAETPEVEVDGQRVRFVMHWVGGGELDRTGQTWGGPGYTLTIVPMVSPHEIRTLWHEWAHHARFSVPGGWGKLGDCSALWWDDEQQRLWLALAFSSSVGAQYVNVRRIRLKRGADDGVWHMSSFDGSEGRYSAEELGGPKEGSPDSKAGPRIRSMGFVRAEDGEIDLVINSPEGLATTLPLARSVTARSGWSPPPISEAVHELIREDLAGSGPGGEP